MGIRGFGTIFGEQQTGDVGNVGIDLFFEMLFESLSKVRLFTTFSLNAKLRGKFVFNWGILAVANILCNAKIGWYLCLFLFGVLRLCY